MSKPDNPEEKYKTLINIGIAFSILLIIGIFITIGVTKAKIAERPEVDDDYLQAMADSMAMVDLYTYDNYSYDDPGTYYDGGPNSLESENDSLRDVIRKNCPSCTYQNKMLDHLEEETDKCAKLIRDLVEDLGDTMALPGVRGPSVSSDFFSRTERDEALFSALFAYRETAEDLAEDAGVYDVLTYRDYFPLREASSYSYIHSWDETEFEQDPVDVMNYLKNMEMDLRYYENQLLWDMMY